MHPPTPPLGPEPDSLSPTALLNDAQALRAAETLLTVTKALHQQPQQANTPEFGQKILLRGELIQAIAQLPFNQLSPEVQTKVLELLKASQALDSEVEKNLQANKESLLEHLHDVQAAKAVQNRYQTGEQNSTRELEG
jgi:hypothetical protein